MKFTIWIKPPTRRSALRQPTDRPETPPERQSYKLAVPAKADETFADLWKRTQDRFERDYRQRHGMNGTYFSKIQDLQGGDIFTSDTIGDLFDASAPHSELQLVVQLEWVDRDTSIIPGSELRPPGFRKRQLSDLDEEEHEAFKRARLEELHAEALHDPPITSRESGDDEVLGDRPSPQADVGAVDADGFKIPPRRRLNNIVPPSARRSGGRPAVLVEASQPSTLESRDDSRRRTTSKSGLATHTTPIHAFMNTFEVGGLSKTPKTPAASAKPTPQTSSSSRASSVKRPFRVRPIALENIDQNLSDEDPIQDDNEHVDEFELGGGEEEDMLDAFNSLSQSVVSADTADGDEAQEVPVTSSQNLESPNGVTPLPSSQRTVVSSSQRTTATPNKKNWSSAEDHIITTALRHGDHVPSITQALLRSNHDRTAQAVQSRIRLLRRKGLVPQSVRKPGSALTTPDSDVVARSSANKRPKRISDVSLPDVAWSEDEISTLRKGIADGLDATEIWSTFFEQKPHSSVRRKVHSLARDVVETERASDTFPKDKVNMRAWSDVDRLRMRRAVREGLTASEAFQRWFTFWKEDKFNQQFEAYKRQINRQSATSPVQHPFGLSFNDEGMASDQESDDLPIMALNDPTEVEPERNLPTQGEPQTDLSAQLEPETDLPTHVAPETDLQDIVDTYEEGIQPQRDSDDRSARTRQSTLNWKRDKGKGAAHGKRESNEDIDKIFRRRSSGRSGRYNIADQQQARVSEEDGIDAAAVDTSEKAQSSLKTALPPLSGVITRSMRSVAPDVSENLSDGSNRSDPRPDQQLTQELASSLSAGDLRSPTQDRTIREQNSQHSIEANDNTGDTDVTPQMKTKKKSPFRTKAYRGRLQPSNDPDRASRSEKGKKDTVNITEVQETKQPARRGRTAIAKKSYLNESLRLHSPMRSESSEKSSNEDAATTDLTAPDLSPNLPPSASKPIGLLVQHSVPVDPALDSGLTPQALQTETSSEGVSSGKLKQPTKLKGITVRLLRARREARMRAELAKKEHELSPPQGNQNAQRSKDFHLSVEQNKDQAPGIREVQDHDNDDDTTPFSELGGNTNAVQRTKSKNHEKASDTSQEHSEGKDQGKENISPPRVVQEEQPPPTAPSSSAQPHSPQIGHDPQSRAQPASDSLSLPPHTEIAVQLARHDFFEGRTDEQRWIEARMRAHKEGCPESAADFFEETKLDEAMTNAVYHEDHAEIERIKEIRNRRATDKLKVEMASSRQVRLPLRGNEMLTPPGKQVRFAAGEQGLQAEGFIVGQVTASQDDALDSADPEENSNEASDSDTSELPDRERHFSEVESESEDEASVAFPVSKVESPRPKNDETSISQSPDNTQRETVEANQDDLTSAHSAPEASSAHEMDATPTPHVATALPTQPQTEPPPVVEISDHTSSSSAGDIEPDDASSSSSDGIDEPRHNQSSIVEAKEKPESSDEESSDSDDDEDSVDTGDSDDSNEKGNSNDSDASDDSDDSDDGDDSDDSVDSDSSDDDVDGKGVAKASPKESKTATTAKSQSSSNPPIAKSTVTASSQPPPQFTTRSSNGFSPIDRTRQSLSQGNHPAKPIASAVPAVSRGKAHIPRAPRPPPVTRAPVTPQGMLFWQKNDEDDSDSKSQDSDD